MPDGLSRRNFLGATGAAAVLAAVTSSLPITRDRRGELDAASLHPAQFAANDGTGGTLRDTAHLYEKPS